MNEKISTEKIITEIKHDILLSEDCFEENGHDIHVQLINPLQFLAHNFNGFIPHNIIYNPNVDWQYKIIRQEVNDGTYIFRFNRIAEELQHLIYSQSYFKPTYPGSHKNIKYINYTIGDIEIKTVYGRVKIQSGIIPGQRELFTLPVSCEYVMKDCRAKSKMPIKKYKNKKNY